MTSTQKKIEEKEESFAVFTWEYYLRLYKCLLLLCTLKIEPSFMVEFNMESRKINKYPFHLIYNSYRYK